MLCRMDCPKSPPGCASCLFFDAVSFQRRILTSPKTTSYFCSIFLRLTIHCSAPKNRTLSTLYFRLSLYGNLLSCLHFSSPLAEAVWFAATFQCHSELSFHPEGHFLLHNDPTPVEA